MSDPVHLPSPFSTLPREPLLHGLSPIHQLTRISAALGGKVSIWAKREDMNSTIAFGGNKMRKLEYLIPDALAQGCDTLVSIGGVQSNHTRAVAGAAAKVGLKARLLQGSWVEWDDAHYSKVGNLQLSRIMGAGFKFADQEFNIEHSDDLKDLVRDVEVAGGKPYYIPVGASLHPLGGLGFARWAFEVEQQEREAGVFFDPIVVCSVSGSTQAGMIAGFKLAQKMGSRKRTIIGIDAGAKPEESAVTILHIAKGTAKRIGLSEDDVSKEDVVFDDRYHAGCYGIPDKTTIDAIKFGAETEGFITDPVYEGKSLAGLMDMVRKGEIAEGKTVLYAHLGGQAALNAYSSI